MGRFVAGCLALVCALPLAHAQDLGVTHISRSPLYSRYKLDYRPIAGWERDWPFRVSAEGHADPRKDKQWPSPGEVVTFTGHVRNHGAVASGGFRYRWKLGAQVLMEGFHPAFVEARQSTTVSVAWTWPPHLGDRTISLEIDPARELPDTSRRNNILTDYTNALSFSIWVEQPLYERFQSAINGIGTRSFEDWIQWQFRAFRSSMTKSRHPFFAPFGVSERVRIEKIVVVPWNPNNLHAWRDAMAQDEDLFRNDGRWQFVADATNLRDKKGFGMSTWAPLRRTLTMGLSMS